MSKARFLGKFRGTVLNNVDPMRLGRVIVAVPDVLGSTPSGWAMPSFPVIGPAMGLWVLPPVGAGVWVEFEGGQPDFPIWTGCYPGSSADVPPLALAGNPSSPSMVLQTSGQNTVLISDQPGPAGGILLKTATGATIAVNDAGITLSNGKGATIVLAGPTVSINGGALTVT